MNDFIEVLVTRLGVSEEVEDFLLDRIQAEKTIPMFYYGTLRVGQYNFARFGREELKIRREATTEGTLWFPGHRSFPGARFNEEGTIVGDLIWHHPNDTLVQIFGMEIGAGYEAKVVRVTYERRTARPRRKTIDAVSFEHVAGDRTLWSPVPGNDWCCTAAQKAHRERY